MSYLENEEKLIKDNYKLIWALIHKYFSSGIYLDFCKEDLFQEGCLALIKANRSFNSETKTKFSTFASVCICNAIRMYAYKYNSHNFSRRDIEIFAKIKNLKKEGKSDNDIMNELNLSEKEFKERDNLTNKHNISLSEKISFEDKLVVEDTIEDKNDLFSLIETKVVFKEFYMLLEEKEKEILKLRYEEKSQDDISKIMGLSQPQVSRILCNIRKKYKEFIK